MRRLVVFLLFLVCLPLAGKAQIYFAENRGQWNDSVLFRADIPDGYLSVERNALVYTRFHTSNPDYFHHGPEKGDTFLVHNLRIELNGAGLHTQGVGEKKRPEYHNYYIGNDPSRWASRVALYEKVLLKEVYPGIDMELYSPDGRNVKYNFLVDAGADPSVIELHYLGASGLALQGGNLHIQTAAGEIQEMAPYAYQLAAKNTPDISVHYTLEGNTLRFAFPYGYQRSMPLVIDPVVVFSTFTGSSSDNFGFTATYDFLGHGFAGGDVRGSGYPSTPGVVQFTWHDGTNKQDNLMGDLPRDCAIMKLSPDGKTKVWATYIGGSRNEQPHSMVVDQSNDLLVLGSTFSSDFPNDGQGFSTTNQGSSDIFIVKISEDGTTLMGMTYIGGSGRDGLNGHRPGSNQTPNPSPLAFNFGDEFRGEIIVDKQDNVYIASCTQSSASMGFPVRNSFNTQFKGGQDGCVFKLSPDLRQVVWGGYIGGEDFETSYGVALDQSGNVFVCGGTSSSSLSFSSGGLHANYLGGTADGYVLKFSPNGMQILGGSFIGTTDYDQCHFVQVDKHDHVFLTGQTRGSIVIFPDGVYSEAQGGQFIYKLSNDLRTKEISTVYGTGIVRPQISPTAFLVDSCERIFVSGWGGQTNASPNGHGGNTAKMVTTPGTYDSTTDGSDFYLAVFSKNMGKLLYATFIGGGSGGNPLGEHVDGGTSRFDPQGIVYQSVCGGCGGRSDFPTTDDAYSRVNNSTNCNNALFKLDFENLNAQPQVKDTLIEVIATRRIDFSYYAYDDDEADSLFIQFQGEAVNGPAFPKPWITAPSGVWSVGSSKTDLSWQTNCAHLSLDTIKVRVLIRDKGCPDFKEDSATISIVVLPPPAPMPPQVVCMTFLADDAIKLSWKETDTSGYLSHYLLYKRVNGSPWMVIDTFYANEPQEVLDTDCPDNDQINYCYMVVGVNVCGTIGEESYEICSVDQHNKPIESTEIITTTVVNNSALYTTWFMSNEPDFRGYTLYKKYNDGKDDYAFVAYLPDQSDTSFEDPHVDVHHYSYCYALSVKDKCGNNSNRSNDGCSILLQGESVPFEHQLYWSPYSQWNNGVMTYHLWRRDDRVNDAVIQLGDNLFLNTLDTSLDYDWGGYWYKIVADELDGNNAVSQSNEIYLVQPPLLHVPTAFTRNNDGLNDVWGISDVFVRDYHLLVYNRWGEKLVDTHDKNYQWDGYFRTEDPFDNVFIWYVVYTGWDESTHTQKGTLTILR